MPSATFSKLSTRLLLTTAFILTALRLASAQENSVSSPLPRFGYYAGYLVSIHTSSPTFYNFSGFNALDHTSSPVGFDLDLIWNLNQRIAIRGGLSGSYTKETGGLSVPCGQSMCAQSSSLTPHIYRFVGGPEFRIRAGRVSPFAYALLGLAHSTAAFNTSGPLGIVSQASTASGISLAGGGGLSFRVTKHIEQRFSVDYNPAFFGRLDTGARQLVQYVRIGTGVEVH